MKHLKGMILLMLGIFLWSGVALAQPKLTIPESIFDFGYVPQNSKISHAFWLYSTGTSTLNIINVKPG